MQLLPSCDGVSAHLRARSGLGVGHVPLIWRVLARLPRMMAATWHKDRLVMSGGKVYTEANLASLSRSPCFKQSPYMVAYTAARLRRSLELDDEAILELVASIMRYVSFNNISHAMLLEPARPEMRAADFTPQ